MNYWTNSYLFPPTVPSIQRIWFNNLIKFKSPLIYKKVVSNKLCKIFFVRNGKLKSWLNIKWYQLIHATRKLCKKDKKNKEGNCRNTISLNHHLIKNYEMLAV